jgi:hypothetical protein
LSTMEEGSVKYHIRGTVLTPCDADTDPENNECLVHDVVVHVQLHQRILQTFHSSDGRFHFSVNLLPDSYVFSAAATYDGYTKGSTWMELTADENQVEEVVIVLQPWVIQGTVDSAVDSAAISGASVQLKQLSRHPDQPATPVGSPFIVGADGKYEFDLATLYAISGQYSYVLDITAAGYVSDTNVVVPALIDSEPVVEVDVQLQPYIIKGTVESAADSSVINGASVQLKQTDGGETAVGSSFIVGTDGRFHFDVSNGYIISDQHTYALVVTAAGYAASGNVAVTALTDSVPVQMLDVQLSPLVIQGTVKSAADSSVISGASVQLMQTDGTVAAVGSPIVVGADGKFGFVISAGYTLSIAHTYALVVTAAGYAASGNVAVTALTDSVPVQMLDVLLLASNCPLGQVWDATATPASCQLCPFGSYGFVAGVCTQDCT